MTSSDPLPPELVALLDEYARTIRVTEWSTSDELRRNTDSETAARAALDARLAAVCADARRLDYLEAHDFNAMCWNVPETIEDDRWAAPMEPNNGWTLGDHEGDCGEDEEDDSAGKTLRDAIDWSMKQFAAAAPPIEAEP